MFQAVIFDMDGVMFDTEPTWGSLWGPTLQRAGLPLLPGVPEAMRGTTGDYCYRKLAEYYGPEVDGPHVMDVYYQVATEAFADGKPMKPGLMELLDCLDARGIPYALASSSPVNIVMNNLEVHGLTERFRHIVTGKEVAHSKPAPDIFLEAARRMGAEPARTIVIEDSFPGVHAGFAGGFFTVMVPDTMTPTAEVAGQATMIASDLHKVKRMIEACD